MTSQSTLPPDDDEDTIELELTPEETRRLSRAARQAYTSKGRYRLWPVPLAAALLGIAIGIAASVAWRRSPPHHVAQRIAPSPLIRRAPPTASQPVVLAQPQVSQVAQVAQDPPVRVRNPFDPQEVFEFPTGTTRAEARQKVSQLLMQRALERSSSGKDIAAADKRHARND